MSGALCRDLLEMVTAKPTITLDLENGQRITLDLKEAKELVKILTRLMDNEGIVDDRSKKVKTGLKKKIGHRKNVVKNNLNEYQKRMPAMSEVKQREIIGHIDKRLSSKPMTLSSLLKGISYSPNDLPYIRSIMEDQPNVAKQIIGKRIYYSDRKMKEKLTRSLEASSSKVAAA